MANELPIPPEAIAHRSVEMIRVWLANGHVHCVLNIGFWENQGLDERAAWGILLADIVHHIADAHKSEYARDHQQTISSIRRSFEAEMDSPTTERLGEFVVERRSEEG
jgi:Domain of unknown function (DUF5076)